MELATLQLPMVLFTTLVPMASGAFIGLAIMFFTTHFSDACLKRIDLWTLLPIGITVVGFIAGVAFLADPRSAVTVFQGIDAGSMIVLSIIGSLLGFLSVVYWVIAGAGMLSYRPRMVFAAVLGASALVYSLAIGAIYVGSSVPTWNSVLVPIGMMGFCVAGGVPLGVLVVALAGGLPAARTTAFSTAAFAIALVGAVVAEWLGGEGGLGVYMTRVRKSYAFDKMFAVIFLVSIISLLLLKLVGWAEKKAMPYNQKQKS